MIKKIIYIFIALVILCNISVAKYVYEFNETIITLSRDVTPINAKILYSTEEITNKDVTLKISCNKEVEHASGFELSEDKQTLIKKIESNENGIVKIRDISGNEVEVKYDVDNIDKENPKIIGCDDGGIYQAPLILDYYDNKGIRKVNIDRYNDILKYQIKREKNNKNNIIVNITEHPLNTIKYKYYINEKLYSTTNDITYTFAGLEDTSIYNIKIQAIDTNGNILDEQTELIENIKMLEVVSDNKNVDNDNDIYIINKSGNYQIKVEDNAGNQILYKIKVK